METLLSFKEALEVVLETARLLEGTEGESLPLAEAHGRVLAEDLLADRDQPPFDRSTRDGFAMRAAGEPRRSVTGLLRAGEVWHGAPVGPEQAVEIMTGAPLPDGADAVVMIEHVAQADGFLTYATERAPAVGQNIVSRGAEMRVGAVALPAGTLLKASEIAIAASVGAAVIEVFRRPRVAILATGDELVELDATPEPYQIRNSNSYALAALVAEAGGEAVPMSIVRDRREDLAQALAHARRCDLILFSGGVSMGKYDLVEDVLAEAGARFFFTGVKMQPGKPAVLGSLPAGGENNKVLFLGLPGNPISTQVTFLCFAAPLLRALCGGTALMPTFAQATLGEAIAAKPGLTRLLPAVLTHAVDRPTVRLVAWQGSGDLRANAQANCYALLPADHGAFVEGDLLTVLMR